MKNRSLSLLVIVAVSAFGWVGDSAHAQSNDYFTILSDGEFFGVEPFFVGMGSPLGMLFPQWPEVEVPAFLDVNTFSN